MTRTATLLLGIVVLAACATVPPATIAPETNWSTTATGGTGFAGAGANVNVRTSPGGTSVAVAYREATGATGTTRHWHIHRGRCGDDRGIFGDPNAYPPLRPGADGTATATATIPMRLESGETYFVQIHESPNQLGSIVACGELSMR